MKYLLGLLIPTLGFAATLTSKIHDVELAASSGSPHLVKLENGRVAFLEHNSPLLRSVEAHHEADSLVEFSVNEWNEITTMTVHYPQEKERGGTRCTERDTYHPKACQGFTVP